MFEGRASFTEATAAENVDFAAAEFGAGAIFCRISVAGLLSLSGATFGDVLVLQDAFVESLEMRDNEFASQGKPNAEGGETRDNRSAGNSRLNTGRMKTNSIEIDLKTVELIEEAEEKCRVLEMVEKTARSNDKPATANDASFRRQQIRDQMKSPGWEAFHHVFHEWITGYFVRPLHPAFSMLAFAMLAWGVRLQTLGPRWGRTSVKTGKKTLEQRMALVAETLGASIGAIFSLRPEISVEEDRRQDFGAWIAAFGRWIEWLIQKALTAVLLIALANASPGVRDVINAIFRL